MIGCWEEEEELEKGRRRREPRRPAAFSVAVLCIRASATNTAASSAWGQAAGSLIARGEDGTGNEQVEETSTRNSPRLCFSATPPSLIDFFQV
jgi:hypothetical protein